ncbi:MAG: ribosomal RNA small subunit methyltransferase A [Desulfobulbaceae bacterium]|nr:MAG: ribosomal RNA small subunit methyltransferase A [Desulfobulbaceae bacterium]
MSLKDQLNKHGLAPSKKFGQNFLVNPGTARRIVSLGQFSAQDTVMEVGVGMGALTSIIAEQVNQVIGIEIDRGIIRYHQNEKTLPSNVKLVHEDILKLDFKKYFEQTGGELKIIANLPYSISNPFIFKVLDNHHLVSRVTVMLQKEVADRLTATPGSKEYGIPTVLLNAKAQVTPLLKIKPAEFHPRPKVDSQVIDIQFLHASFPVPFDYFKKVVRHGFANRRKTLLNNLLSAQLFAVDQEKRAVRIRLENELNKVKLKPTIRAESLTIAQFIELSQALRSQFRDD